MARYLNLCERLRTCWLGKGVTFRYPPASEEQLRTAEGELGYPLPSLLRLVYSEVANGGVGLLDWEFPLVGVRGGCPARPVEQSDDGRWLLGATIENLVSRSGWRLHPCIEDALREHPECHVVCSECPAGFVSIMDGGSYSFELDLISGRVYGAWYYGDLPLDDNQVEPLLELHFFCSSLEEMIEDYLARTGCSDAPAHKTPLSPGGGYRELSSDLLAPKCEADSVSVWRGLYRDVSGIVNPSEPDEEE